ncbi:putative bifunctional diguanylate cyclase/phosphodiesterase [Consotaella salsifontis]|nr:GGDEF domain-containing phosphodiesterase [Consotaella salsifontis]
MAVDALDLLPHPVLIADSDGHIEFANPVARSAFGTAVGRLLGDRPFRMAEVRTVGRGERIRVSHEGRAFDVSLAGLGGKRMLVSFFDVTDYVEKDITRSPKRSLNDLLDRKSFLARVHYAAARARSSGEILAVHFLDVDRFKLVNDTLGYAVGDRLLEKVAERIVAVCPPQTSIAHFASDEFAILQSRIAGAADAEGLAKRLVDVVGRTYVLDTQMVNVGLSVGIALSSPDAGSPDTLVRQADLALARAKRTGRGHFCFCEPSMMTEVAERRSMETDLRSALALKQLELHYQPQIDLAAGRTVGFEALLRWRHPLKGNISPALFIPLAEETKIIREIGDWVILTAAAEAARWPDPISVAVNVSPVQFQGKLVHTVASALQRSGLAPERFAIEITEGILLDESSDVLSILNQLKDLGVHVVIDDFGTGYSSLGYLRRFPFHKLKIDQSFIRSASDSRDCAMIVKAVAGLGKSLGIKTTAEGVETEMQLDYVRAEEVSEVQGYLTGRPMDAGSIGAFLAQEASRP